MVDQAYYVRAGQEGASVQGTPYSVLAFQNDGRRLRGEALQTVNIEQWNVDADSLADQTTRVREAIADAKRLGLRLQLPLGTIYTRELALGGGLKPWGIVGRDRDGSILKRYAGGTFMNCGGSDVPFILSDFTADCSATSVPADANHGISIGLVSNATFARLNVLDYFASGLQIYDDGGTHRYRGNLVIDCYLDGMGIGQDGILIANMDECWLVRCIAKGNNSLPGYAIQLKNVCWNCFVIDCQGDDSLALLAMGNDGVSVGVQQCVVQGFVGTAGAQTTAGYIGGKSQNCVFSGLVFDMQGALGFGLRPQNDENNTFTDVVVRNVHGSRSAVYLDQASKSNYVQLTHVDNLNTTARVVEFHASSERNLVVLERMTNPPVRVQSGSPNVSSEAVFNTSTSNGYSHSGYTMFENCTIAAGVVTPRNMCSELLILSGEGGLADNIETIDPTYFACQGRTVALKNANSSPTLTVVNTGNLIVAGGVSFALDSRSDTYETRWVDDATKWAEVARANNG